MRLHLLAISSVMVISTLTSAYAADVSAGRRAWLQFNCYGCHGNNGAGGMGPNVQHSNSNDVTDAMKGGEKDGGMRSFIGTTNATTFDAANIAAYLATIGTTSEPKWLDWWHHL